jgi:fructan beta-fructosidase
MVVYDEHPEYKRNAAFYTSTNLKEWNEQSHLPGYFECTELFELPVDGDAKNKRWVVFAADAKYAVGKFDGKTFTPEHEGKHQVHWGPYYASQTFDNSPDGRKIQMGWLRVPSPGPYNQHFSFPHRLTLRTTEDGLRMFAKPIKEIEGLRAKSNQAKPQELVADKPVKLPVASDLLDVRLTVEVGNASAIELNMPGRTIKYDAKAQKLNEAPLKPLDGHISIQVLADRSLTEIVGNDGRVFISGRGPAKIDATAVSVTAKGGNARLLSLEAHELKSIWNE